MVHAFRKGSTLTVLVLLGLLFLAAVSTQPVDAYTSSCGVSKAKKDVAAAKRAVAKAQARLRESRYVLSATKAATASYGSNVGRWVRLARRSGWSRGCIPHLMYVINRESRGSPKALNPSSGAAGLLQFMPQWYRGQWGHAAFDPFDPGTNLEVGAWLYRREQWTPWAL